LNVSVTTTVASGAVMAVDSGAVLGRDAIRERGRRVRPERRRGHTNVITMSNLGFDSRRWADRRQRRGECDFEQVGRRDSGRVWQEAAVHRNNGANIGQINLQGGTAEFSKPLTNGAAGQIVAAEIDPRCAARVDKSRCIALASGVTDVWCVNNNTERQPGDFDFRGQRFARQPHWSMAC